MFLGLSLETEFPKILQNKNPEFIEKRILSNSQKIADFFKIILSHNKTTQIRDVYKNTIVDSLLLLKFNAENFESRYHIPVYAKLSNGSVYENGYEVFIIKGLRETLWDYKSESFVKIRMFSYPIDPYVNNTLDVYFYRSKLGSLKDIISNLIYLYPNYIEESSYVKEFVEKTNITPKESLFEDNFNKELMYKVFLLLFDIAYDNFSYIKEYSVNPAELLIKTASLCLTSPEEYFFNLREGEESGLSLLHMRVIDETEIITSGVTVFVIDNIKDLISKSVRRKTDKFMKDVKEIQLSMFIFESRQMEHFFSPVAFLSDLSKLMIYSSPYSFRTDEIEAKYRDVHPNHINNLCAITTGDKANTGLTLHFTCNCELDEHGRFVSLIEKEKQILNRMIENNFEKLISLCQ